MTAFPDQSDAATPSRERLTGRRVQVLLGHDQLDAGVERNDIPRVGADVDDFRHPTMGADLVRVEGAILVAESGSSRVGR